jgi:hypothetical protein
VEFGSEGKCIGTFVTNDADMTRHSYELNAFVISIESKN